MEEQILDRVVVIHPDIHLWSGRKRLRQEDLERVSADQLPPETLASLGSKKICDPKDLNVFERIKKRFERDCSEIGIRFLSGYAIPEARIDDVLKAIHRHKDEFERARHVFLSRYQERVDHWVAQNPEWGRIIRRAVTPKEEVAAQLRFDFQAFRIKAIDDAPDDASSSSMSRQAGALPERLFREIASDANDALVSFDGRDRIGRRALRHFVRIREKLDGLSFLDDRVMPVVDWIDEKLDLVPATGPIEGSLLNDLYAAMTLLSCPDRIKQLGASRQQRRQASAEVVTVHCPAEAEQDSTHGRFDAEGMLERLGPLTDDDSEQSSGCDESSRQASKEPTEAAPTSEPTPEETESTEPEYGNVFF